MMKKINLLCITLLSSLLFSFYNDNKQQTIDPNWVTLPTDKGFRWIKWEDAPYSVKEMTKHVVVYGTKTLFEAIKDDMDGYGSPQGGCKVEIALMDLNENGIYGFAVSSSGSPECCGYAGHGCSFRFIEDGGILVNDLGQDHNVKPGKDAVISSVGKRFPFKVNTKLDQKTKDNLKKLFTYK